MRWLNYATERSLYEHFISLSPAYAWPLSIFTISLYAFLSLHLPLLLSIPLGLHYPLVCYAFPSLSPLFLLSLPSYTVVVSTLPFLSTWHFFLWWPCSQAVGLYLVWPMIKSAGLTSALDRPIHPTDTQPPPHTGRLNNLCTISNMKEDLLTLQSPPVPFPISLDC